MRANEVIEEDEHGNEIVDARKRGKALFGFVPCLELFVEAFDEVVGDVIAETLHADMANAMERLNRHPVSTITVTDDGLGSPYGLDGL